MTFWVKMKAVRLERGPSPLHFDGSRVFQAPHEAAREESVATMNESGSSETPTHAEMKLWLQKQLQSNEEAILGL